MAPQPDRAISFRRHLVLLFAVAAVAATRAAATAETAAAAASAPSPDETDHQSTAPAASSFLRARCATTLYPALCRDSLLPYAGEFQTSHARLARVAADVAAARLRALLARVRDLLHHAPRTGTSAGGGGGGGGGPSEADALHDCASTISSAANLARQSSAELAGLDDATTSEEAGGSSSSRRARWGVSNAKTWLSAAITNEGTCADGIEEAGARESSAGKEVGAGVASVRQHTSIALALVNGIPL